MPGICEGPTGLQLEVASARGCALGEAMSQWEDWRMRVLLLDLEDGVSHRDALRDSRGHYEPHVCRECRRADVRRAE